MYRACQKSWFECKSKLKKEINTVPFKATFLKKKKKKKIEFENPSGSRVLAGNFELWNCCFGIFKRGRCHDLFVVVVAILSS